HRLASEHDLVALLEANVGVGLMPASARVPDTLRSIEIEDLKLSRTVHLYAVAGRRRSTVMNGLTKLVRTADWSAGAQPCSV
ncbi:MAG: LysR family transcriptional regulator, partial [Hyphomicrobiaceae bacterium]